MHVEIERGKSTDATLSSDDSFAAAEAHWLLASFCTAARRPFDAGLLLQPWD
jgi:hypothetical protein